MLVLLAATVIAPVVADTSNYWQQSVRYVIQARLDEPSGVLSGRERISYLNNSPDTLTEFYLHLYLNAFRPGSRWADRDSIEGRRRFNDLQDPDYAFERIGTSAINGIRVTPEYPYAPDSTIARLPLPTPLSPGGSMVVEVHWDARPSTRPRRQGRRGRRFDFAQWYPRVVAYDRYGWQDHPLYPAGEFYGEFATYDVSLDVAVDQVIGATGVPVEGDPGWESRKADRRLAINYQRDWYSSPLPAPGGRGEQGAGSGCAGIEISSGRKRVRFYAKDVHHFAMSLNPRYVYEEGRYKDVVVRVLYNPEDRASWGNGVAVARTVEALRWLDDLFGPYPWPQLTNVHRIEGGGTEFPMMVMDGSASLGLILHEVGHNYLMGILANNEWKEGFLDEGFSNFQGTWYREEHAGDLGSYYRTEALILGLDLDGWSQPVSTVSEDFRDFRTYNRMIYSKGELFYHQLRYIVGHETMKRILREYYRRWKLKHVTENAFRDVAEEVSGMDLSWFFGQWLHGTPLYDYAIGRVKRRELPNGGWETRVEVKRKGDGWMPVEIGEPGSAKRQLVVYARATGRPEKEVVTFRTPEKPGRLMLDPRVLSHDWNFTNNRERRFLDFGGAHWRFDTLVEEPARRDRAVRSIAPTVWYNDAAELTVGFRARSNYLGRYNRKTVWLTRGTTGGEPTTLGSPELLDFYVRFENPTWLRRPLTSQSLEAWVLEGRTGGRLTWQTESRRSFSSRHRRVSRLTGLWMVARNAAFLDRTLWEDAATVELAHTLNWELPSLSAEWTVDVTYGGGLAYTRRAPGTRFDGRYDVEPYGRITASAAVRRWLGDGKWRIGTRAFVGGYLAESAPVRQRAIPVNGADPYEAFGNPLVRSRGAVFVRPGFFYHSPGNGNLRGFAPGLGGRWMVALNAELERMIVRRRSGILRSVALLAFADGAIVDTLVVASGSGNFYQPLLDAGAGVRFTLSVGDLAFPLRVEFPLYLNRASVAHNIRQGTDRIEFRWLISFEPLF